MTPRCPLRVLAGAVAKRLAAALGVGENCGPDGGVRRRGRGGNATTSRRCTLARFMLRETRPVPYCSPPPRARPWPHRGPACRSPFFFVAALRVRPLPGASRGASAGRAPPWRCSPVRRRSPGWAGG